MQKENNGRSRIWEILLPVITVAAATLAVWLRGGALPEILRMLLMTATGCGILMLALRIQEQHSFFFPVLYVLFLAGSLIFPFFPAEGWPYPAIFVGLMLFGGRLAGICAGSVLLIISTFLGQAADLFPLYFLSALAGILLFSCADQSFRVLLPALTVMMVHFLCMSIPAVLMAEEAFRLSMLLAPAAGTLLCFLLLTALWEIYSRFVLCQDACMELNDPENPLLELLKECSGEEYFHSIHTAYLCDRIAKGLGLDADVVKAGGYYHRIGILQGVNSWENTSAVIEEYSFPESVRRLLKEYLHGDGGIESKEGAVLLFADTAISSVNYLFSEDREARVDYPGLMEMICRKILESGELKRSRISLGEIETIKKILMEEEKYYEFLR